MHKQRKPRATRPSSSRLCDPSPSTQLTSEEADCRSIRGQPWMRISGPLETPYRARRWRGCGELSSLHRGCPTDEKVVASIGVPRDTAASGSPVRHLTTTIVAVLEIGPYGFSVLYFDYTLEATASGWKVVNRRLGRFVE